MGVRRAPPDYHLEKTLPKHRPSHWRLTTHVRPSDPPRLTGQVLPRGRSSPHRQLHL